MAVKVKGYNRVAKQLHNILVDLHNARAIVVDFEKSNNKL